MGFLDNASNLLNRGVANAGRGTKVISLKAQIADLGRSRNSLMAQLGGKPLRGNAHERRFPEQPREAVCVH